MALARAFVAKAVLNLPTTEALIDRLKADHALRRLCGFDSRRQVPDAWRFSRAFTEFVAVQLPARVYEPPIRVHLSDQLMGHMARDATAIEARERPAKRVPAALADVDHKPEYGSALSPPLRPQPSHRAGLGASGQAVLAAVRQGRDNRA